MIIPKIMILITGAGGKTGQAVIEALRPFTTNIRAWVRRKNEDLDVAQFVGDMAEPSAWVKAMAGVEKVYLICPNMHPDEVALGQMALEAAKATGVSHLVYHSVLHPQVEAMPHHWRKMQVEALLFESGLPYTILQPTAYMQNIQIKKVQQTAVYQIPYPVKTAISLVDLRDVARVAAKVLTESGHEGATYELVGTRPLTQTAVAQQLSQALGQPIRAQEQSLADWEANARQAGLPDESIRLLLAMFRYYAKFGLMGNTAVLSMLLGRQPTNLSTYLQASL